VLQDVTPPGPVRASWDEVNQAQQQRDRVINEAWAEYNRVIPRALGQAEEQIPLARAYEVERLNRARGEAARFESVFEMNGIRKWSPGDVTASPTAGRRTG
jgi:modulator of FtsH protease HflK